MQVPRRLSTCPPSWHLGAYAISLPCVAMRLWAFPGNNDGVVGVEAGLLRDIANAPVTTAHRVKPEIFVEFFPEWLIIRERGLEPVEPLRVLQAIRR